MRHNLLVLAGRGASGLFPVLVSAGAARAFGLTTVGEVATGLALAHAVAEVADGMSQRHVPRLADEPAARTGRVAAFNVVRAGVLLAALLVASAAAPMIGGASLPRLVAFTLIGIWVVVSSGQYAVALASADFLTLAAGPFVPLVVAPIVFVALQYAAPDLGVWNLVLAVHAARLLEVSFLSLRAGWPSLVADPASVRGEWRASRYLFLQALLSVAYLRLTLPFVSTLTHDATLTGSLSLGLTLLSGVSLVALAATIPAYQRLVAGGRPHSMADAVARTRRDLATANGVALALLVVLWFATPRLLAVVFHVPDPSVATLARIVLLGALPEATGLFSGIYYHAVSADRSLFALSTFNAGAAWLLIAAGFFAGGPTGLAWGFALSRLLGVAVVVLPVVRATRRHTHPDRATARPRAAAS